jgi:hypothetical protein
MTSDEADELIIKLRNQFADYEPQFVSALDKQSFDQVIKMLEANFNSSQHI